MTHPLSGLGCVICASHDVVASISVERNGIIGHYPVCADHIEQGVRRIAADAQPRPELAVLMPERVIVHQHVEQIEQRPQDTS